jgi:hypothetical protein
MSDIGIRRWYWPVNSIKTSRSYDDTVCVGGGNLRVVYDETPLGHLHRGQCESREIVTVEVLDLADHAIAGSGGERAEWTARAPSPEKGRSILNMFMRSL